MGYAGHGVALATLLGKLVAEAIVGNAPPFPFESALPTAPLNLYSGHPWFLPLVGTWQRFLDMVS
jgi:glycine/D-amino acid oxidase-like deaminating enzyme